MPCQPEHRYGALQLRYAIFERLCSLFDQRSVLLSHFVHLLHGVSPAVIG